MNKEKLSEYRKKYDLYRHHAWAGSIFLSVILALRIFLEIMGVKEVPDYVFLPLGLIIICYMFVSVILTYKYREGLNAEEAKQVVEIRTLSDEVEKEKIKAKLEKKRLKLEKKKAKIEAKKAKKQGKKEMGKTFK